MDATEYTGVIKKFLLPPQDDGFAIFKFETKAEGFVALGNVIEANEGDRLFIKGDWEEHSKFGKQFKITAWEKIIPTDKEHAIAFLSSGMIKGIGPVTAGHIVNTLGANAIETILEKPERLTEVKGIGSKKAAVISRTVAESYDAQRTVSQLIKLEITPKTAYKIYKRFGRPTMDLIKNDPYCLTDVGQIGFVKADEIAQKLNIKKDAPFRVRAGVLFTLNEALWNEGHTYLPLQKLTEKTLSLLNKGEINVTKEHILNALHDAEIFNHDKGISLAWVYHYENKISEVIKKLIKVLPKTTPTPVINRYEKKEKIKLTERQKQAVNMVLNSTFSILTGGPGVGKTATIKAILWVFKTIHPRAVIKLAAPTGRAARKMSEMTGELASTLHKLLQISRDKKTAYNKDNPLPCDLLIVDETSMVDLIMIKKVLDAVKAGTRILFVGDVDQLPSVGPGNILRDMLSCNTIPRVVLDKVFRQAAKSQIITNAHRINKGLQITIDRSKNDFFFFDREQPQDIRKCMLECVKKLPYDISDIQILSPMKKGPVGTYEINKMIQKEINPNSKNPRYENKYILPGDKVIQQKNNYTKQVFNGDIGMVKRVEDDLIEVQFNGDTIEYTGNEVYELAPAFCITTHKSQGSEFKVVIVPLTTSHYIMLARNLLYTAITRAKEKIVLIGTRKALAMAIRNNKPVQRCTLLQDFLEAA